jgi:hypothetical protein
VYSEEEKYFVQGQLEQPKQDKKEEPKEPNKEGPLSFALIESPFTSVSTVSHEPPLSSLSGGY